MARGSSRMRALKAMSKRDISEKRYQEIMSDYSANLKSTPRRAGRGRSGQAQRYNAALRILRAGESNMASLDTPGVKSAQKCMQRHMKQGKDLRGSYSACGLKDVESRQTGTMRNPDTGKLESGHSLSKGDTYWGDVRGRSGGDGYYGTNLGDYRDEARYGGSRRRTRG